MLPISTKDSPSDENSQVFSFDNDTNMKLDGPGYALSFIFGMVSTIY